MSARERDAGRGGWRPQYAATGFGLTVPDPRFRSALQSRGITTLAQLQAATSLTGITGIRDLEGVQNATALTTLDVTGSQGLLNVAKIPANVAQITLNGNGLTSVKNFSTHTNVAGVRLASNSLNQAALEAVIDQFWAIRTAFGTRTGVLHLQNNPGSAGAATSRATQITAIRTAGATVTI